MRMPRYYTNDAEGVTEIEPSETRLRELLASLDGDEHDFPEVSLVNEAGFSLTVHASGMVVLENLDRPTFPTRHRKCVPRPEVLSMWKQLAAGDVEAVKAGRWSTGDGT